MSLRDSLIGQKFDRWLVIDDCPSNKNKVLCRCDCGTERYVYISNLTSGKTHSCGCLASEVTAKRNYKHGDTGTRLYHVWNNMKRRCNDPKNKRYKNYGGKGIRVCDDWNEYDRFRDWANETGYDPDAKYGDCTIDRIDVDGDYTPDNCRWTTIQKQNSNRTTTKYITHNGETKTMTEWEHELGFKKDRIAGRIRRGWDPEKALTTPVK